MKNNEKDILWKDRVRHLGLPLSCTKYYICNDRLYIESGFFTTKTDEILLYRILDIKTTRTLFQKVFGVGTITLYSADQSDKVLEIKNIKHPKETHELISELVEEKRNSKGIAGREMFGSGTTCYNETNED